VASDAVILTGSKQPELSRITQSRSEPAGYVFRARPILFSAEGSSYSTIKQRLGTAAPTADIIGLYLDPPEHAAVFCVDEKTAIQALDRLDPVLPLSPGRAERHGFEYSLTNATPGGVRPNRPFSVRSALVSANLGAPVGVSASIPLRRRPAQTRLDLIPPSRPRLQRRSDRNQYSRRKIRNDHRLRVQ